MTQSLLAPRSTTRPAPLRAGPVVRSWRADVQGLRAVAVTAVVLYHLWPREVPGGFVGVDVFFVISGFLITAHLLAHPPRRLADLADFWSRRVRRLLPAALLVLAVTLLASRLVAPVTQWSPIAERVRAAALYVLNWRLANDSVDYLAAGAAPSPVEHYWSLSVEEQFYLGWPVLIGISVVLAAALRIRGRWVLAPVLALVLTGSLWRSIALTGSEPARAYFVTDTRVWEFAVGGGLAGAVRWAAGRQARRRPARRRTARRPGPAAPVRQAVAAAGLVAIAAAAVSMSGSTPFPGWRALLPTGAAVAVLAAAAPCSAAPGRWLAGRPVQWLGNVSYSLYLWHWPLIVLVPYATGRPLGPWAKAGVLLAALALAGLTKRLVEDPFRRTTWGRPLVKPFVLAAAVMAAVVACASGQVSEVRQQQRADRAAVQQVERDVTRTLAGHPSCVGAAALTGRPGRCHRQRHGRIVPTPVAAAADKSAAWASVSGKRTCFANLPAYRVHVCHFGRGGARTRIALVGNSHAAEWLPAFQVLMARERWSVTTYLAARCALADVPQQVGTPAQTQACQAWVHHVANDVARGHYDLVVFTNRISVLAVGETEAGSQSAYQRGYAAVLHRLRAAGEPVLAIRDTPYPGRPVPDCLAAHPHDYPACDGTRRSWLPHDPVAAAVRQLRDRQLRYADLTRYVCGPRRCGAVVGGVVVYFDGSHLTATYARTIAPYLLPDVTAALR